MKTLTLWLGAFGFAINKVLWENNKEKTFFAYELNKEIVENIWKTRTHPYFFKNAKLPENIKIIENIEDKIWETDLLIIAIPAQFIGSFMEKIKNKLKKNVIIINLAKWIDIKENKTIFKTLEKIIGKDNFIYGIFSGGMIASEVVEWKKLWADLGISDFKIWEKIKKLLENENLEIKLQKDILNIELYWSIKNIASIIVWYYEGKWNEASTVWYHFVNFYNEMKEIIELYWWNKNLDFSYYSLWWDLIASAFWNSRNRYFWKLLWEWKNISEVLEILKKENKHAEWYETLKAVYKKVENKKWFNYVKMMYKKVEENKSRRE